jgi:hypothetical protein
VCIPKEERPAVECPILESVPTLVVDPERPDIDSIVRFILDAFNLQSSPSTSERRTLHSYRVWLGERGFSASLKVHGLHGGVDPHCDSAGDNPMVRLSDRLLFEGKLQGIAVRVLAVVMPKNTILSEETRSKVDLATLARTAGARDDDERRLYAAYREHADDWYRNTRYRERGLHVFWWRNQAQVALTFLEWGFFRLRHGWNRLYVFCVADPATGTVGEVALSICATFPGWNTKRSFRAFSALLPIFDSMAGSLQYHGSGEGGRPHGTVLEFPPGLSESLP